MRRLLAVVLVLGVGACGPGKTESPDVVATPAPTPTPTPTPTALDGLARAREDVPLASSASLRSTASSEGPRAPLGPAPTPTPAEPDDRTLERSPGLTAALPLVRAAAPKVHPGLAGTPGESPAMGASDAQALVKVFVFSDFQCPVCRRAVEPLKKLARTFPDDVQVVFKQHPLTSHARAEPAARASMAAMAQGRFWEMHDRLFEAQSALDDEGLAAAAQALGLDMAAWQKALGDTRVTAQIAYESAQAEALDASGTPAFFVNGVRTVGWGSYLGIESQVKQAIEAAKALLAKGVPRADVARAATAATDAKTAAVLFGGR